nr:xylulose kinase-1 [Tanacetum cinerariifolium]
MIAILDKYKQNTDFHQIVDFVEASHIRYALTFNPTVYVSHIRQFWSTARVETSDEETKILATVDGMPRTISESSIRRNIKLNDEAGISLLPDAELFENLTLMGYNISPNQKFTFQKGFNEFNSNIATALVCLATDRVYNFSKMIFDGMVRNVNNKVSKFLMYPRNNETVAKYLQEYYQFAGDLSIGERIELIINLVKYQDNYAKVLKYQTRQRKPLSRKQQREFYTSVLKSHAGWKAKHFKGMSLEEIKEKFNPVWKQIQDFVPIGSKEESERFKKKGIRLEQDSAKKQKTSEKVPEEKLKEMMQLVPVEEVYVEALQVKHLIID